MKNINHHNKVAIYDPEWSKTFLIISPSCLFTGVTAGYCGYWVTGASEAAVFLSSFMHWRDPHPGWYIWRIVDITVVHISFGIHVWALWNCPSSRALIAMACAASCFAWSLRYHSYTHHAAGWFFSCLSNLLLTHNRYNYCKDSFIY